MYVAYLDPLVDTKTVADILDFMQLHGWVDELTRVLHVRWLTHNPSSDSLTTSALQCRLDNGGAVSCSTFAVSLRLNLYDSFSAVRTSQTFLIYKCIANAV